MEARSRKSWMSRGKAVLVAIVVAALATAGWVVGADHVDSPFVRDNVATDIADVFAFSEDPFSVVLAMTVSGVLAPQELVGRSIFDKNTLYQFEISTDGDADEEMVIQAFVVGSPTNQQMEIVGPVAPEATGSDARIVDVGGRPFRVRVSTGPEAITATRSDGLRTFAGVRDDPFFFDLARFQAILDPEDPTSSFAEDGTDFFAGLNSYAIVVEVPLELLGAETISDLSSYAVWGTTSRR